ncbi:aa3-type cytochrome c oxidase subunit IV [Elioraea sp.]|uniref:aa3-type cytochrome c oxidase subunit IV n=1 Tax=Elioraea sp. TaxID=2185103 RepID=UPI0025BA7AF5|nr:aa3-type cytochrome c oxidase subunit IV [Elioraea sp.]
MAEYGSSAAGETVVDPGFLKDREAMLGGFVNFTTYSVAGIIVLLILMAIFLI